VRCRPRHDLVQGLSAVAQAGLVGQCGQAVAAGVADGVADGGGRAGGSGQGQGEGMFPEMAKEFGITCHGSV
jgi:hypothetical protein